MTKTKSAYLAFIAVLLSPMAANADLITVEFSWVGDGGYSAVGTLVYDDAFTVVTGAGEGGTTGIDFLEISIFDPGMAVLQSVVDVLGGTSNYDWMIIQFDTVAMAFIGYFDMGKDDFIAGDYWIEGNVAGVSRMFMKTEPVDGVVLDMIASGTKFTVKAVPEPGTLALLGIGLAGMGMTRRRKKV